MHSISQAGACGVLAAGVRAAEYQIIASPDVAVASLSREDIKNILLGNKIKWDGGVVPAVPFEVVAADGSSS